MKRQDLNKKSTLKLQYDSMKREKIKKRDEDELLEQEEKNYLQIKSTKKNVNTLFSLSFFYCDFYLWSIMKNQRRHIIPQKQRTANWVVFFYPKTLIYMSEYQCLCVPKLIIFASSVAQIADSTDNCSTVLFN